MTRFLGFALLALLISPALAAPSEIELVPLEPAALPSLAKNPADCASTFGSTLVKRELKVGGAVFQSRHGCTAFDSQASLAITNGQTTYTTGSVTVRYRAANMTEAPLHIRHLETQLTRGTLANGDTLIVHQVDVLHEEICNKPGCGKESTERHQKLTFCTLPTASKPPACASTTFVCATTGCQIAAVTRGALAIKTATGALKLTVRADG
jgi:hypothetical protein